MLLVSIALLIAALVLFVRSRRNRTLGGLPTGEVVYSDTVAEEAEVLVSRQYGLRGKPDSLVRTPHGDIIPVERKSGRAPSRPYDGDLAQATAYCILVEEHYGRRPPYMRVQYSDRYIDPTLRSVKNGFLTCAGRSVEREGRLLSSDPTKFQVNVEAVASVRIAIRHSNDAKIRP